MNKPLISIKEIMSMSTSTDNIVGMQSNKNVHESCFRSFQILEMVKYYLFKRVPHEIIFDLILEMEGADYESIMNTDKDMIKEKP